MAYIPFDKIKSLREAAKNGDARARKILIMQMNGEDFGSLLDEYFAKQPKEEKPVATSTPIIEDNDITDPKLKKFLEYNGVKKGDQDYESTIEAYYQEFPKARPSANLEMKATNTNADVILPNDDDGSSIYGEEDEEIEDDVKFDSPTQHRVEETVATEEKDIFDKLMGEEIDAIRSYDDAILKVMNSGQYNDNEKKGIIAKLEEIKHDEREHWEELKRLKENSIKKEEKEEAVGDVYV